MDSAAVHRHWASDLIACTVALGYGEIPADGSQAELVLYGKVLLGSQWRHVCSAPTSAAGTPAEPQPPRTVGQNVSVSDVLTNTLSNKSQDRYYLGLLHRRLKQQGRTL